MKMNVDDGKKIYTSYDEAARTASRMRLKLNENYVPYKTENGWMIGGVHVKKKQAYKRVKTLQDIKLLFSDVENIDNSDAGDIVDYYNLIYKEYQAKKSSKLNGDDTRWFVEDVKLMSGRELEMNNDNEYLVVFVNNGLEKLRLKMGGAFKKSISLVKKQAESLINKPVIWHTWNSKISPNKWGSDSWFYLLEKAI